MDRDYDARTHPVGDKVVSYSWREHVLPFGPPGSPYHYIYVPLTFRVKLCFGLFGPEKERHEYEFTDVRINRNRGRVCRSCGGYPNYTIRKCVNCASIFIKDFTSAKYCEVIPYCWSCLPELPWTSCPYHRNPGGRFVIDEAPLGINPRIFTQEELDSFDISSFDLEL